ncbi:MAG: hypothetical protein ACI9CD_000101 [Candidatus Deianiraeaceae bacterium]
MKATIEIHIIRRFAIIYNAGYCTVDKSKANAEYVVNPPRKPVMNKTFRFLSLINAKAKIIAMLPMKLHARFAIGNESSR